MKRVLYIITGAGKHNRQASVYYIKKAPPVLGELLAAK